MREQMTKSAESRQQKQDAAHQREPALEWLDEATGSLRCFKDALDRLPDERRDAIYALMPGHPDFEKLIDLFDRVLTATAGA